MNKITLDNRQHVNTLVRTFYGKIQDDDMLGPIFNSRISNWEDHFELLTDFWSTVLRLEISFKGNPARAHVEVDQATGGTITPIHFGRWLQIWFETIDELFIGRNAQIVKDQARIMSTNLYLMMFKNRGRQAVTHT